MCDVHCVKSADGYRCRIFMEICRKVHHCRLSEVNHFIIMRPIMLDQPLAFLSFLAQLLVISGDCCRGGDSGGAQKMRSLVGPQCLGIQKLTEMPLQNTEH